MPAPLLLAISMRAYCSGPYSATVSWTTGTFGDPGDGNPRRSRCNGDVVQPALVGFSHTPHDGGSAPGTTVSGWG
ncbi:hypothetical protein EDC01DRAFT_677416 [Geopyxis carbonaria]|nr:hypothetical protein EDC01DRAFT_677416 [Geopyxis carbonaria]